MNTNENTKSYLEDFIPITSLTEQFVNNLEAAESAKAIDAYTANVRKHAPKIKSLHEKYPEYLYSIWVRLS